MATSLAPPPRTVPFNVRAKLLCGGFMNQFGWFFFGFGMIFVWVFALKTNPLELVAFRNVRTTTGLVTAVTETNATEGGSETSDGTPIYQHDYVFEVGNAEYTGTSFVVGRQRTVGRTVTVEYARNNPKTSRIQGERTALFGPLVLFVVIFPIVGLIFMAVGIRRGRKAVRLLRIGQPTTGRLIDKKATGSKINDRSVYKFTFEFETEDGETCCVIAKTHLTSTLQDDDEEPLVYDPLRPTSATLLDHLPGAPRVAPDGTISGGGRAAALSLVVPVVSVLGHLTYIFLQIAA